MSAIDQQTAPVIAPTYGDRYVAFLDVLGFRAVVTESISNPVAFAAAIRALSAVQDIAKFHESLGLAPSVREKAIRIYTFSDSVVITSDLSPEGLATTFEIVARLTKRLIYGHIPLRGAIVRGLIFEQDRIVFGPALVAAHDLESKVAIYPRVVVTEQIVKAAQTIKYEVPGRPEMSLDMRLRRDADGAYFLDWLNHYYKPYSGRGFPTDMHIDFAEVKEVIEAWISLNLKPEDQSVLAKWEWFASYFNVVVSEARGRNVLGPHEEISLIDPRPPG